MIGLLLSIGAAWPCAALLTRDAGSLATSDAQEVILERNETGVLTRYRVSYDGDAESFGWLIVTRGAVGEGDINEASEGLFDVLRETTQPNIMVYEIDAGGSGDSWDGDVDAQQSGCGSGCRSESGSKSSGASNDAMLGGGGEFGLSDTGNAVEVTAEGFAGPFAYTALSATDTDGLVDWLDEHDLALGGTETTLEHYIDDGNYTFIAVTLTPETANTPSGGRTLPALAIQSDATQMEFPARMSLTGMAEELRTTVWVLGEETAEVVDGWSSTVTTEMDAGSDPAADYDEVLRNYANMEEKYYCSPFSGMIDGQWVTRFDTLAHRSLHTDDPVFDYTGEQDEWHLVIIASEDYEGAAIWFWLPLFGVGIARRRRE